MRMNPDPVLEPLSDSDLHVLGRWVPVLILLMLSYLGWAWWRGQPFVDIEATASQPAEFRLDINTAGWPELAQLPGIGEVLARRIVEYRETNGPFRRTEDLVSVHGVGDKLLEHGKKYMMPIQTGTGKDDEESIANEAPY